MDTSSWLPLFTLLALELALLVAIALAIQPALKSALWRRTLWQATLVSLTLITLAEVSGLGRSALVWVANRVEKNQTVAADVKRRTFTIADPNRLLTSAATPTPPRIDRVELSAAPMAISVAPIVVAEKIVWWPGALWLGGFVLLALRVSAARGLFAIFQRVRQGQAVDSALLERVQALARRMGLRQRVRVTYTNRLAGPIAFGSLHPSISLPVGFQNKFSPTQQEAMLAHELAHLSAGDPAWHLLADLVAALLWWHPLVWWSRRQLRSACEAAADEASLLIEDGAHALAECLVTLGGHLVRTRSFGGLGIEGDDYRSGLGCRVKRLLNLKGQSWRPHRRGLGWILVTGCPMMLVMGVLAGTSSMRSREATSATLLQSFQKSVIGLAWSTILQVDANGAQERVSTGDKSLEAEKIDWQPWNQAAVAEARAQGRPVLVYFTADWSVTAQANEKTSLNIPSVREKLRLLNALAFRGDYSRPSEAITAELRTYDRPGVPLTLVYSSDPNVPPQILPALLTPDLVLQALDQVIPAPSRPADATKRAETRKNDAPALVLQAKTLLDDGKPTEAVAKLQEALTLDPANKAAAYYLALAGTQRGKTPTSKIEGVPPLNELPMLGGLFTTNALSGGASNQGAGGSASVQSDSPRSNPGRRVLTSKLDSIKIERMSFDNAPLGEAVRQLQEQSRIGDPEKQGVHFIINSPSEATNGQPAVRPSRENLADTPIRVPPIRVPTLRNLTLREAIEIVIKCATVPLKYTVEDYAIVISPAAPESPVLHNHWFKVEPSTLNTNLRDLLGTNAVFSKGASVQDLALTNLRRLLDAAGVDLSPPKHVLFNDRAGLLMVRATLSELDAVEQLIQMLSTGPEQVVLEVRFCEVTEEDGKKLGFDWFLGNRFGTNVNTLSEGLFAPSAGVTPWDSRVTSERRLGVDEPAAATITGILTDAQFGVVLRAFERRRGMNVMTAPKVTTLSGRQAQIKTVEIRYIVTDVDINTNAAHAAGGSGESIGIQPVAEPFELGPVLDVVPTVAADGFSIHLTVIASIKEFIGYDNKEGFLATLRSGKSEPLSAPTPLPKFRLRQVVTSAVVWDGQTLVLSGGSMASEEIGEKNAAGMAGQKGAARLLRSNAATRQTKSLLVFVTPTIIDPAGNRVHSPDELPIRKNSSPSQKAAP